MVNESTAQYPCRRCPRQWLRRIGRHSFMERVILPRLGFYPWECSQCRSVRYIHDQGNAVKRRRHSSQPEGSGVVIGRR